MKQVPKGKIITAKCDFVCHLEKATQKVSSWPKWKQGLLGTAVSDRKIIESSSKKKK